MEFRTDINGLRAIAVFTVVLYHFGIVGFSGGFIGVDVFFVISGYLMTAIIVTGEKAHKFSLAKFYLSRARRIVPALAVLCAAMLIFGWFVLAPVDYVNLSKEVYSSLGYFSNMVYLTEAGYFDAASHEKWLLHTWSLSVEWQFYLLYPLYVLVALRLLKKIVPISLAIWIAFAVSLALSIFVTSLKPIVAFYILPTRAWEMFAGALVFVEAEKIKRLKLNSALAELLGIVLIAASAVSFSAYDAWPSYLALVPVVGAVFVIMAGARNSILTGSKITQFIGQCSYSIYLWHWPVVVFIRYFGGSFTAVTVVVAILTSVLLGWISFRFIEQPARQFVIGMTSYRQTASFAFGLLPLIIVAVMINFGDGVNWRYKGDNLAQLLRYGKALDDWEFPTRCGRMDIFGKLRLCRISGEGSSSVLFIGDSEVEQWWPRLSETRAPELTRHEIVLATYGGCPPLPRVNRFTPGYRCDEFFNAARRLAFKEDYRTIVFGSVWTDYFYGAYKSKRPETALYVYDPEHGRVPVTLNSPIFMSVLSEFSQFVSDLKKMGKRVIIILPIPGRYDNIPKSLYLAVWRDEAAPDLSISESGFRAYESPMISNLRHIANETGAEIIDPLNFLCNDDRCPVLTQDGTPLYRDGAHLRPFAVRTRANFLDDITIDKTAASEKTRGHAIQ